jgi:hypothetical protein
LHVLGLFPVDATTTYKVFEGNHRLAALVQIQAQILGEHPDDIAGQTEAWTEYGLSCNEDGVALIPVQIFKIEMPISLMITLGQCKHVYITNSLFTYMKNTFTVEQ